MSNKLQHIAFIMDGNNRWSKKKNISQYDAYMSGATKLINISQYIFSKYQVKYISAFALSKNNLNRSNALINTLKSVLQHFLEGKPESSNYDFQIIFKGDRKFLKSYILKQINALESLNKDSQKKLFIFINYSGQNDILNSFKSLSSNKIKLNKKNFINNLETRNIPDPDLLIRTGGYQRISDFMLYQLSFTELIFTKTLWPDLNNIHINKFISNFIKIDRKFGL